MKTINILIIIACIINLLFLIQSASALTANSSNYSVSMFGTGLAVSNPSSTNYTAESLSTSQSGTRNAESNSYTVNLGFFENTTYYRTVSITSYSISPSSAVVGSTIGLYISALNSQKVWAKITSPNAQEQTLNLINGQTVNYVPSPSVVGRYNVIFYANSSTGAIASVVDYFDLTAQSTTPPSGGGSSGGGGTTTIIEKCTYNWDCTPWSVCSDGKQTRECKNIGACTGNESKPIEEMQCSEALFDIVMKFKEIKLTENKTLKFNVDLTETKGVEKIDVHIKYSVIDSNNNEMFSQIETRAIQGNLTYEREIEDIKLTDGEYTLRIDVLYGNLQRAFAEQKFKIANGEISTEEAISTLQKTNIFVFVAIGIIVLSAVLLILYLLIKFSKISTRLGKIEGERRKYKRKYLAFGFVALLIVALLVIILKTNITGKVINNLSSYSWKLILVPLIIVFFIVLLIVLRKKLALVCKKIIEFLSNINNKHKKYPSNSILGLMNKQVYSESGNYIGKVSDIILGDNRIDSLKIEVDKKHKFNGKGAIINYRYVKSVSEIIIIDKAVSKHLEKS